MSDRGIDSDSDKRKQTPIDDVLVQFRESLEGLGIIITRLEDRLSFVTHNRPRFTEDETMGIKSDDKPSGDSQLLLCMQTLNNDIKIQRDRVMILIEKLDV